ncbi:aldo/keto reductase [soil metagenome]
METRRFGASNIETTVIGFGTWPIGGARYGPSDDESATRAIHAALDVGITCFDTAPSYGNGHAEEVLGKALKGRRAEAMIVTKGGMIWDEKSVVLGQNSSREYLVDGINQSLRRLDLLEVDLFLLHWPDSTTPLSEVGGNLEYLVELGKTRAVGVCNLRADKLREIAGACTNSPIVASQVGFSLFDRRWATETFSTCCEHGIGVMAYGPLAHGLLTGTVTRDTSFEESDWRKAGVIFGQPLLTQENREKNFDVIDQLRNVANDKGVSLAQLATAWVLTHAEVSVALVGARNETEIVDSAGAARVHLTESDLRSIDEIMDGAAGMTTTLPAGGTTQATTKQGE